jgi:hypothetical protein
MTDQAYEVKEKLARLEKELLLATPNMAGLLREIHKNLKQDPDIVTLLSEEECSIMVSGLMKQTNTDIATKILKTKKKPLKSLQIGSDL